MNIVIINNLPHYNDARRWDFDLVRYQDFISHADHTVSYIVNDDAAYGEPLKNIIDRHGPIDRLIAFSESLQDVAARLRESYDIPGNRPAQNRLGRDKIFMKQKVQAAGLRCHPVSRRARRRALQQRDKKKGAAKHEHRSAP